MSQLAASSETSPGRARERIAVTNAPLIRAAAEHSLRLAEIADGLGYDSIWVAEVSGLEAFSLLAAVSQTTSKVGLGTGVVPALVRSPSLLAMAAATLQSLAPEREVLVGVGISSRVVLTSWHGCEYPPRPLEQMREFLLLLRLCLSGERVNFSGRFYQVKGFRLSVPLMERRPKIVLGALGPQMLELGGALADGVLLNYLPARHVPWCVEQVRRGGDATIYANVHVGVGDPEQADKDVRFDLFSYTVVDAYADAFRRAGYGEEVAAIRAAHAAHDRAAALAAVSPSMIEEINPIGDALVARRAVQAYRENGVEVPVIFPLTWGSSEPRALETTLVAAAERP
jgi:5,10-methylenetetrahydromethanopterin reductase